MTGLHSLVAATGSDLILRHIFTFVIDRTVVLGPYSAQQCCSALLRCCPGSDVWTEAVVRVCATAAVMTRLPSPTVLHLPLAEPQRKATIAFCIAGKHRCRLLQAATGAFYLHAAAGQCQTEVALPGLPFFLSSPARVAIAVAADLGAVVVAESGGGVWLHRSHGRSQLLAATGQTAAADPPTVAVGSGLVVALVAGIMHVATTTGETRGTHNLLVSTPALCMRPQCKLAVLPGPPRQVVITDGSVVCCVKVAVCGTGLRCDARPNVALVRHRVRIAALPDPVAVLPGLHDGVIVVMRHRVTAVTWSSHDHVPLVVPLHFATDTFTAAAWVGALLALVTVNRRGQSCVCMVRTTPPVVNEFSPAVVSVAVPWARTNTIAALPEGLYFDGGCAQDTVVAWRPPYGAAIARCARLLWPVMWPVSLQCSQAPDAVQGRRALSEAATFAAATDMATAVEAIERARPGDLACLVKHAAPTLGPCVGVDYPIGTALPDLQAMAGDGPPLSYLRRVRAEVVLAAVALVGGNERREAGGPA